MTIKKLEYTTPELHRVQVVDRLNGMQDGGEVFDAITLKGLPQTAGAPTGYGDLGLAIRNLYRNVGAVKIGGQMGISVSLANRTIAATFTLNARPARVRFHILNPASSPITGLRVSVAPSANIDAWNVPSGGLPAFQVLTLPTTIAGATIANGTNSVVPPEVVSDWINPRAIPRTDGGSGFILMVRLFQNASSVGARMFVGGTNPTSASDFAKYTVVTGSASEVGDFTTTSATFVEAGDSCPTFWMEVEYETPIASIAIVGDSIIQGRDGDPGLNSAAYSAAFQAVQRINASGKPCQLFNAGWGGATTHSTSSTQITTPITGYLGQFMSYVQNGARPTVAAFCPWSVNNPNTYSPEQLDGVRQSMAVFISLCQNNRIIPALVTPAPRNDMPSAAAETSRRSAVQAIKNYCQNYGILLIDRDDVYTNYSSAIGGYKLPEWCIDNVHPTAAGHAAESVEWESKLLTIL